MDSLLEQSVTSRPEWSIENHGGIIHVDDYENLPNGTIAVCDIETNEGIGDDFKIVCVGLTTNGQDCYIYFDIRDTLIRYLQSVRLVTHNGKGAEIPWLERYGVKIEQLYFDTQIGMYVYDSSKKSYALKKILENQFQIKYPTYKEITAQAVPGRKTPKHVTLDKLPKELVAEYNAADVFFTHKLWTWLRQNMSIAQKNFFETIEMPMNQLIYEMEQKGVKIDTNECIRIHKEQFKIKLKKEKEFKSLVGIE